MHINENILLSSTRFKKQGDFWIDKLSGISDKEETNLLFTNRRHTGARKDRQQIDFSLPRELVQQMVKLSKKSDLSIYILLLAGLKSLIYRYTGNKDIFVVSPLYRPDVSDETINDVLLIRDALYEEMSFKELVLTVRQSLLDAYENQDYPFDRLAEACLSPRQLENNPFMTTVACVFENIHDYDERLAARLKDQVIFLSRLDESRMNCSIIFAPGRYEPYYIEKIPGHFTRILEQSVDDIDIKISGIFYLSEQEKKCLLYDYSSREYRYPVEPACYKLFEGQVEKTPDKVALVYEDSYLTYRELDECSLGLAYVLRERGVTAGTIAALMVEPSFFMIIGIMGILRAGGAFLPIGVDYPEERIDYMLKDSNAKVLLSEVSKVSKVSGEIDLRLSPAPVTSLAYVIYTSGSTGLPKGVLITHGNLTPMLLWSRDYFGLGEHTRVLQNLSYTFDFGVFELLTTIIFGGTLYFFNRAALTDALEYSAFIDDHQINTLHTTPSFLSSILSPGERMSWLRILHLGGERLSGTLIDTAARQLSRECCIYNGYGPTETTINSSIFKVVPGMDMSYRDSTKTADNTPIGKPSANNTVYILDSRRRLVPIGAAGELYIGGGGVAPGYLNRPEMTAEKFVDYRSYRSYRTYSLYFSKKLYKTGDLCCWLPDGNIEFLGRIDHQVKIRGFRVELGEIESRLLEYPGIKEALVIARDHFLCAYIVCGDAGGSFLARLKEYLSQKLPDYMVPSYLLELDKIPLTPSGKADRSALPEPETGISGQDYAAPLGRLEEELVSIWGELLGIEKDLISVNADFFQLGGHSLLAMGLISKLHQRLDVKIPLGQVLQTPTIRELVAIIKGTVKEKYLSIKRSEQKEYYVLSSAQKRMYILQQMELESIGYNMPIVRVLKGKIDKEKLEGAFNKLISRHESLRTSFHMPGEEPFQRIHETVDFEIECFSVEQRAESVELKRKTREDKEGLYALRSTLSVDIIQNFVCPFDLSKAPLLRVGLIKEDENRHILMLDMHHIISDGISMDLIVRDFGVLYDGKELPEMRLRYRDYAEWQNKRIQQEAVKKQEMFWLQTFAQEVPLLDFPTDYTRPVVQGFEGDSITFEIGGRESESIHHLTQLHGGTVYMVLLAVVYTWLARLGNQEDIVVGTPTAGRWHADLHDIVGMFVNTLALRNYPSGKKPFVEFFEELKNNVSAGFENQDYQFEDLVEKLSLTRDTGRNPIFDVMFAFQNTDRLSKRIIKTETDFFKHLEPYETGIKIAKFDLSLTGDEVEGRFLFTCEYSTALFRKESIERFIHYFKNILNAVIRDPGQGLWEIEILSQAEREQVLFSFNRTKAEYPAGKTIHELFQEQVERTSDSAAVVCGRQMSGKGTVHLTYWELNRKSNQLARLLRKKGVQANSIVSLMVERSLEMIVGLYAILKAGGAYLPVETDYPEGRIRYMLEDSGSRFLLTREEYAGNIDFDGDVQIFNLEDESLYRGEAGNLQGISTPDDMFYMIYTSGSTGKPRGVMVKTRGFVNLLHWYVTEFALNARDCVLLIAPISFDLAQKNLYAPLIMGGSLCLASPGLPDYHELSGTIAREQVTVINSAPSVFYPLIEFNSADNYSRLKSLRYLFLGGEPIQGDKLAPWLNGKTCRCEMVNTYGPTECTDIASSFRVNMKDVGKQKNIPIGAPIYNVSLFVLDNYRQVVPIGVTGELCIGGIGLSMGYYKNPGLTAAKFIQTPHLPSKEVYRTGDLARWLADGNILFLGRIDHQVKVRGFRIELGEIEAKLQAHEKIKEAVVVARKNDAGNTYLCAYVVSYPLEIEGERETLNIPELREYLAGELPDYMVPSYYVQLEKLPLTPSGKTNRNALPEPETGEVGVEYAAPGNFEEKRLVGIWSEILRIKEKFISVTANFFELGGHSLSAVGMIAVIHKKLDVKVPLRQVLKNPTIRELARYVKKAEKESCASIEPVEEKDYYVISSAQKRMYILQQMEVESIGYNIPMFQVIKGELVKGRFEEAVRKLVARHESLRTSFHMMGEEPVQRIQGENSKFQISNPKQIPNSKSHTPDIIENFVQPFDLSKAPLFRVGLGEKEKNRHILMVDMHHIISDGISTDLILRDFMALLDEQELPELRIQYKDYAEWQQGQTQEEDMKKQEIFWLKRFEGEIPVLDLPTDYVRPPVRSFAGAAVTFEVDEEETRGLCQLVQSQGGTVYMVLLAVVYIWLAKLGNQEDIVVGTPTAGRRHADLHDIVGMFVNTLALRNYPSGEKPFAEFFEELKENVLGGFENQDYQFEDLVEKLLLTRDTGRNPVFDVMFAFQSTDQVSEIHIRSETDFFKHFEPYETDIKTAKFDLSLTGNEIENRLLFTCEYSTRLFKAGTIERFILYFKTILSSIINDSCQALWEIEILGAEERHRLLYDLNATQWDYPQNKTLRDLFEDQVNKTPGNIAVVYEDRALTYRDLNTRARHLAGILISRGASVKPGMIVGIMAERSLELYVGILAILKSGSAYLPVDPEYPEDRINYMLKDSNVRLLLTREPHINRYEESYEYEIIDLVSFHFRGMPVENWNWQETARASGDLAYVIYTSGSTGVPRGVMVEHGSVVNLVVSKKKRFNMNSGGVDRVLQFSSICFDASVEQIFVAFCSGSVLVIIERNTLLDKEAFAAYILRHGVTHLDVVPSFLREFDRQGRRLSCLRRVVCGGEVCPVELAEKWCGDYRFYNAYGPTETTVTSTEILVEEVAEWRDHLPIGRPLDNTTVYVLDRWEKPVPFGVVGEIVIGGAGVARGYLNRPELTAEKFIDIHHSSLIIHHSYRTGDLARWLADGNLEYRGRIDHQVKIRGYRIEPGEIERRLLEIESIKEAVVTAKDTNGERYLCAYVVSAENETIRGPELRETLLKKLPAYMVPLYFVQLEEIPLTPGGKTDRKAFPEPEVSTFAGEYAAPGNMVEEKLMEIWSDVLIGTYRVIGIYDNFFELGGHSLNAAVVVSRIHRAFDVRVPLVEFFKAPTIKGLSGYIKAASKEKYVSMIVVEEKEYYILSSAQKRLYYLQQLVPESTAYNMPNLEALDCETGKNREKLEQAFRKLIRRHESLRTSFHIVENEPVQRVRETVDFEIQYYTEDISRDFVRPFDLAKAPLMRVGLIKTGDYEFKIIIDMHHIAADGISTGVLLRDFTALYQGEELAELRFQYKDYAVWQRLKKEKGALKAQQDYWERQFNNGIPVLNLPTDYARPELQRFEGNIVKLEKSNEETRLLKQLASEQGTTLFMTLLTLYNILLFKITGQGDIVVGVPIAGRGHADLEKIIGMFVNTLPIRNRLLPEQTFEELLKDVKERTLSAFENQDCQLEDIVEMIGEKRDPGRNPLFDVMFAFQGTDMQPEKNSRQIETDSPGYEYENRISKFDMTLTAVEARENLIFIFDYSIRLFKKETVERFVEYFKEIINTVLDNPEIRLENIRVLHDLYNEKISLPQMDIEF